MTNQVTNQASRWAWTGRAQTLSSREGDMLHARKLMASPYTFGNLEQIRTRPPNFPITALHQRPREYRSPCSTNTSRNNDIEFVWKNKPEYLNRTAQLPTDLKMKPAVHEQGDLPRRNVNRRFDVPIVPPKGSISPFSMHPRGPSARHQYPGWEEHNPGRLDNEPEWQEKMPEWQLRPQMQLEPHFAAKRSQSARPLSTPHVTKVLCHETKSPHPPQVSSRVSDRIQSAASVRSSLPSTTTPARPPAGTVYRPSPTASYYHHHHCPTVVEYCLLTLRRSSNIKDFRAAYVKRRMFPQHNKSDRRKCLLQIDTCVLHDV
mmetsp:Transcript_7381/g.9982  ORF Transcript_7381/g.9982 Transcript_7381/m.9982 type:complete len:318 (+) Transcript_7381:2-955(+)